LGCPIVHLHQIQYRQQAGPGNRRNPQQKAVPGRRAPV
jgi:hypothetical protein